MVVIVRMATSYPEEWLYSNSGDALLQATQNSVLSDFKARKNSMTLTLNRWTDFCDYKKGPEETQFRILTVVTQCSGKVTMFATLVSVLSTQTCVIRDEGITSEKKCLHKIQMQGIFLISDWGGRAQLTASNGLSSLRICKLSKLGGACQNALSRHGFYISSCHQVHVLFEFLIWLPMMMSSGVEM